MSFDVLERLNTGRWSGLAISVFSHSFDLIAHEIEAKNHIFQDWQDRLADEIALVILKLIVE
jgi:hypothetical protein